MCFCDGNKQIWLKISPQLYRLSSVQRPIKHRQFCQRLGIQTAELLESWKEIKWEALKNKSYFGELYLDLVKTESYLLRCSIQNLETVGHAWPVSTDNTRQMLLLIGHFSLLFSYFWRQTFLCHLAASTARIEDCHHFITLTRQ